MRVKTKSRNYADGIARMQTEIVGESMTRQDHKDECDINKIYAKTQRGEIVLAKDVMPEYGDFSNIDSYDVMLEAIMDAEDAFLKLPASVREEYGHDPAKYYEGTLKDAESRKKERLAKEKEQSMQESHKQKVQEAKALLAKEPKQDDKS